MIRSLTLGFLFLALAACATKRPTSAPDMRAPAQTFAELAEDAIADCMYYAGVLAVGTQSALERCARLPAGPVTRANFMGYPNDQLQTLGKSTIAYARCLQNGGAKGLTPEQARELCASLRPRPTGDGNL